MRAAVLTILVSYELLAQAPQPDPLMLERNRALQLADQGHESEALEIILGVIKRAPLFQPAYESLPDLADRAGKRPETLKGLRALVRSGPKYAGVWLGVARLSSDTASTPISAARATRPKPWVASIPSPGPSNSRSTGASPFPTSNGDWGTFWQLRMIIFC